MDELSLAFRITIFSASGLLSFLMYYLMSKKPLSTILIATTTINAAVNFLFYMVFSHSWLLYPIAIFRAISYTYYAIVPQRISHLWFYKKRRFLICSILYCTVNLSIFVEANILNLFGCNEKNKEFRNNFYTYSCIKGTFNLCLVVVVVFFLREPTHYPTAAGTYTLKSICKACRITLKNS